MLKKICAILIVGIASGSNWPIESAVASVNGKTYFWPATAPESVPVFISFKTDGTIIGSIGFQSTWREEALGSNNAFWYTDPVKTTSPNGFETYRFGFGYQFGVVLHGYFPALNVAPSGVMTVTIEILPIAIQSLLPADATE